MHRYVPLSITSAIGHGVGLKIQSALFISRACPRHPRDVPHPASFNELPRTPNKIVMGIPLQPPRQLHAPPPTFHTSMVMHETSPHTLPLPRMEQRKPPDAAKRTTGFSRPVNYRTYIYLFICSIDNVRIRN